ncbi:MAG: heavy metal-associated domain-containing protein [Microgenomates group bacterium]
MNKNMAQVFTLKGLSCGSCEKMVSKRLMKIDGVTDVRVTAANGLTTISTARQITSDEIVAALEGTHYSVVNNSL